MRLISRDDLKKKLDKKENFKLLFVLGDWHWRAKHIKGSIHYHTPEEAMEFLKKGDDIVVYCASIFCAASRYAYELLDEHGYKKVKRYAGGIADWEEHGLPLEGEMVE